MGTVRIKDFAGGEEPRPRRRLENPVFEEIESRFRESWRFACLQAAICFNPQGVEVKPGNNAPRSVHRPGGARSPCSERSVAVNLAD